MWCTAFCPLFNVKIILGVIVYEQLTEVYGNVIEWGSVKNSLCRTDKFSWQGMIISDLSRYCQTQSLNPWSKAFHSYEFQLKLVKSITNCEMPVFLNCYLCFVSVSQNCWPTQEFLAVNVCPLSFFELTLCWLHYR